MLLYAPLPNSAQLAGQDEAETSIYVYITHSICEKQLLQSRGIVPVAQLDSATPS